MLNRFLHVPVRPGESDEAWDARWTALDDDFRSRAQAYERLPLADWPDALWAELKASWEAIFDPVAWREDVPLQATMREIRAADVVRAVRVQ